MKQFIYSIRDNKAGTFTFPFGAAHESVAKRQAAEAVNDPLTMLHKYPEDFDLWYLGVWDDLGKFIDNDPTIIVSCIELKNINKNKERENGVLPLKPPSKESSHMQR